MSAHPAPAALTGVDPAGAPVSVDLRAGRTVVWLLTSSCAPCRPVWGVLGSGDVAVTPGPATESRRQVASLAPPGLTVVMSSEAWFALEPGPAPWRVVVEDGVVVESASGVGTGSGFGAGPDEVGAGSEGVGAGSEAVRPGRRAGRPPRRRWR